MTSTLARQPAAAGPQRSPARWDRRWWIGALFALLVWSVWTAGLDPSELINGRGWRQVRAFFAAMFQPDLSGGLLRLAVRESAVTVGYAVLGSALATAIGLVGGVLLTERIWMPQHGEMSAGGRFGWILTRLTLTVPRSMHEVVFGLVLVNVLGLNPLVAILAIGIPFGAITAKVFAELLDAGATDTEMRLRATGSGRLTSFLVGTMPNAVGDLASYAFYRFECALRSAAVLGIIGAGGLGFQLALSFQSLRYDEMWTMLWALIILSGLADRWSSLVRHRGTTRIAETSGTPAGDGPPQPLAGAPVDRVVRSSVLAFLAAIPSAWVWLDIEVSSLWSSRARTLAAELVADSVPPSIGRGGWTELLTDSVNTITMAVLAIALSFALAWPLAFVARRRPGASGAANVIRRAGSAAVRFVLLIGRAVPPPVWAFVVVFVLFPGLWPGAVGLAIYNAGVLGRLMGEVLENEDPRPAQQLGAIGATSAGSLTVATIPAVAGRFAALGLYRWEVLIRETVIVGVVGAAGLGRRLDQQTSSFDYDGILATVIALFVVTIAVDSISALIRRTL